MRSTWLVGTLMPPGVDAMPGPFTSMGTRMASSKALAHFCCMPPWAPSRSPWSEVNTTIVSSAMPDASSASRMRPMA